MTRSLRDFVPLTENVVNMYVCGPTVYNYIHIGNARPAINYDVVRRYFEYKGYEVIYVSNFTDVDDKLINRSKELNESVPEIAEKYIKAFYEDVGALNVKKATSNPRVMHHMGEIIDFMKELVDEGYAYESDGDVYFRTRQFDGYGKLSHQSLDDLKVGARIEAGEQKEDALDFTLWKKAKPGEISWNSPFGKGRPGWHIECSVMAYHELGSTIDIHIDNEKMSKSLGNFILVHDIIKEVDPDVLRFFMISVHYRSPINYNLELVGAARSGLERIRNSYKLIEEREQIATDLEEQSEYIQQIDKILNQFETVMDDDFNTANAVTAWYDLAKLANKYVLENTTSTKVLNRFKEVYSIFSDVLGIPLKSKETDELLDEDIEQLIEERNEARKNKDFARADEIRDMLKARHIILEDTPQGVRFKRG